MTEQDLIDAHGVRVGQIYRRNSNVPLAQYDFEVVYVSVAFVVMQSISRDLGVKGTRLEGIEGRWSSPWTTSIDVLKQDFVLVSDSSVDLIFVRDELEVVKKESFDDSFKFSAIDQDTLNRITMGRVHKLRLSATAVAKEWLLKDGYLNCGMEETVYYYEEIKTINVQVALTAYRLPTRIRLKKEADFAPELPAPSRRIIEEVKA